MDLLVLGENLRSHGKDFASMEGKPDPIATVIRLNRLGKCISAAAFLIRECEDEKEIGEDREPAYQDFRDYYAESMRAFSMGAPKKKGSKKL